MYPWEGLGAAPKPVFWNPFGDVDDAQCPTCGGNDMHVSRTVGTKEIWLACARLACTWKGRMTNDD